VFLKVGRGNILVGHEDSELMNQYMIAFIALHFQIFKSLKLRLMPHSVITKNCFTAPLLANPPVRRALDQFNAVTSL